MNNSRLVCKQTFTHREWLELRKNSIGGSDAAAIVGENPYVSPYSLWVDKTSSRTMTNEDEKVNEAMRQGTELEGYVAWRFEDVTGKKVKKIEETIFNPDYPFAHANVDRWLVGENAGLECKTTNKRSMAKYELGSDPPPYYYLQCLHYMAVTGADKYYLAVLVFQEGFYVFEIERDEEMIKQLMEAEECFWQYVTEGIPPEVDSSLSTQETIDDLYTETEDVEIDLTLVGDSVADLVYLKQQRKEIDASINEKKNKIKSLMGRAERGRFSDYQVTWKKQESRKFDRDKFENDHPEIDLDEYYKTKASRVFRVNDLGEH